jgi:hypothetical protein
LTVERSNGLGTPQPQSKANLLDGLPKPMGFHNPVEHHETFLVVARA